MSINVWQKCPVCEGSGYVTPYPTGTSCTQVCPTCNGTRIISTLNGLPPSFEFKMTSGATVVQNLNKQAEPLTEPYNPQP